MTTLCFYQGLHTIGGTVVEIATEDARCLFDFGFVFNPQADARIRQRPDSMVYDCLQTGTLVPIDGLYSRASLRRFPLAAYGEAEPKPFVLISHMHIDHMGALGLLAEDAEVYMSEDSLRLYLGLAEIGDVFGKPHRRVFGVAPMQWQHKGSIAFRLIPVDHDVPGACGMEIVTPDGRICYTGDLRVHGRESEHTFRFAETVQQADVCITEGTMVSFVDDFDAVTPSVDLTDARTEASAEAGILQAAQETAGIVFLNTYRRNIHRLHALVESVQTMGRRFVMQPETALLCRRFDPDDRLFVTEGGEHTVTDAETIPHTELTQNPQRYVLDLPFSRLLDVLDFKPETSLYLHADGVPLGAYDTGYQTLLDFLAKQGIPYKAVGCGGHAAPAHLKWLLTQIAPKTLIPLHSLTPEKLRLDGIPQLMPEAGMRYMLTNGELTAEESV